LTEFATSIAIDALRGDAIVDAAEEAIDPMVVSPAVNRAISRFQNRLHAVTVGKRPTVSALERAVQPNPPNPIAELNRDEFRAFAQRMDVNNVFVMKLRDRKIIPDTMTPGFRQRVANDLEAPLAAVVAHFAAGQSGGAYATQFFKADDKPIESGQQTFEEAVRNSGLSDAQQHALLGL
jgi:hypothetical protein